MTTASNSRCGIQLWLDSADPQQWAELLPTGIFAGVTTNPLLLERCGIACSIDGLAELVAQLRKYGSPAIQLQTWGETVDEMVLNGRILAKFASIGPRPVVKVPASSAGWRAAGELVAAGCEVTLTAVYQAGQVVAAAALGAAYAAPYLGRLDDADRDGFRTLVEMQEVLTRTAANTRLLAASIRQASQVSQLAAVGLNTFTVSAEVATELLADPLSRRDAEAFQLAARTTGK